MKSPRHTARGIVIKHDQILLMERWRPGHHYFSIPGGGIEPGETPEETVVREIAEETACLVTIERAIYLLTTDEGSQHHVFLCRYQSGEPHLPADSPEAQGSTPDNRFKPRWLPIEDMATAPFIIWRPIAKRLIIDLRDGFAPGVVSLQP